MSAAKQHPTSVTNRCRIPVHKKTPYMDQRAAHTVEVLDVGLKPPYTLHCMWGTGGTPLDSPLPSPWDYGMGWTRTKSGGSTAYEGDCPRESLLPPTYTLSPCVHPIPKSLGEGRGLPQGVPPAPHIHPQSLRPSHPLVPRGQEGTNFIPLSITTADAAPQISLISRSRHNLVHTKQGRVRYRHGTVSYQTTSNCFVYVYTCT